MHIVKNYSVIGICLLRFLDDPSRIGADLVEDFVRSDEKLSVKPDQVGNDIGLNNKTS